MEKYQQFPNEYRGLKTTGEFSLGDIVRIFGNQLNIRRYKGKIVQFLKSSNDIWVKIQWGKNLEDEEQLFGLYGNIFYMDEVRRVS